MGEPFTYDELPAVLRVDGASLLWRVTRGFGEFAKLNFGSPS